MNQIWDGQWDAIAFITPQRVADRGGEGRLYLGAAATSNPKWIIGVKWDSDAWIRILMPQNYMVIAS